MPVGRVVTQANQMLHAEAASGLRESDPRLFDELGERGSLGAIAARLLDLDETTKGYVDAIPASLQEGIRASIFDAVDRGLDVHLQFSPSYDFGVQLWEYGNALSVHLSGPYTGASFPRESFSGA